MPLHLLSLKQPKWREYGWHESTVRKRDGGRQQKCCDPDQHGPEDAGVATPLSQQLTPIRSRLQGLRDVSFLMSRKNNFSPERARLVSLRRPRSKNCYA